MPGLEIRWSGHDEPDVAKTPHGLAEQTFGDAVLNPSTADLGSEAPGMTTRSPLRDGPAIRRMPSRQIADAEFCGYDSPNRRLLLAIVYWLWYFSLWISTSASVSTCVTA
jgi:hypothetical protein